jgi:hypothetical protein
MDGKRIDKVLVSSAQKSTQIRASELGSRSPSQNERVLTGIRNLKNGYRNRISIKGDTMEDFPLWLKVVPGLLVGGTLTYATVISVQSLVGF